jgi:hypothetical protein
MVLRSGDDAGAGPAAGGAAATLATAAGSTNESPRWCITTSVDAPATDEPDDTDDDFGAIVIAIAGGVTIGVAAGANDGVINNDGAIGCHVIIVGAGGNDAKLFT